ncbi:MAG: inositol monophosphatase [Zoogloeaceae bacterium]|jgi:myo-inositol-1(or 4)-monophosphatase|nr:inositol monophosphatase [Zoogloeaceae bacterium]
MTHRLFNDAKLNIAIKAARRASRIITRAARDLDILEIQKKDVHDYVTNVDREAEDAIVEILREATPDFAIIAEERGVIPPNQGGGEWRWIVDPLDGTTNFMHGFPQYAVSIALARQQQVELGVIYDPNRNELFAAARGQGAYLNEKRLRVAPRRKLDDALIGTGFPFRRFQDADSYLAIFRELMQKTAGIRRPGAASLDLAYVAAGRLDGFWEFGLAPWDMAAGSLLIVEAGGLVTDREGEADYLDKGHIVAGAPKIFPALLSIVQAHLNPPLSA